MNTELFIVEGLSASNSVQRVVDPAFQSVLGLQGKPMNTWNASQPKVLANPQFSRLIQTLGNRIGDEFILANCPFSSIILLFDPDADGIHGQCLLLWFFHRWMPPLLESGRILSASPNTIPNSKPIRGLASIEAEHLRVTCIDPHTRSTQTLSAEHALASLRAFKREM